MEDVREGRWDGGKRGVSLFSLSPSHRPFRRDAVIVPQSPAIVSFAAHAFFES